MNYLCHLVLKHEVSKLIHFIPRSPYPPTFRQGKTTEDSLRLHEAVREYDFVGATLVVA